MVGAGLFPPQQRVKVLRLFILTPRKDGWSIPALMPPTPAHTAHHTLLLLAAAAEVINLAAVAALADF
jgi:hypothetical protein